MGQSAPKYNLVKVTPRYSSVGDTYTLPSCVQCTNTLAASSASSGEERLAYMQDTLTFTIGCNANIPANVKFSI